MTRHLSSAASLGFAAWVHGNARAVVLGFTIGCTPFVAFETSVGQVRAEVVAQSDGRIAVVTSRGRTSFDVEVVDTVESRAKGLMFRTEMAPDRGMLFDFRREEPVWFWMKNTYLPLDMIFARADGTVIAIAEHTTPLSEATVPSNGPVRFVLEVNAGTAARLGMRVGDRLSHPRTGRED